MDDRNSHLFKSEASFPEDDSWNQYNEDEELDAEYQFQGFEEIIDSDSDTGLDEHRLHLNLLVNFTFNHHNR